MQVPVTVESPRAPGRYELVVRLRQVDGAAFAGSPSLRRSVEVRGDRADVGERSRSAKARPWA